MGPPLLVLIGAKALAAGELEFISVCAVLHSQEPKQIELNVSHIQLVQLCCIVSSYPSVASPQAHVSITLLTILSLAPLTMTFPRICIMIVDCVPI